MTFIATPTEAKDVKMMLCIIIFHKQSFYSEVGDYTTRIDSGGYCWIRIQDQSVRTIPILSGLMHIYSPGYYG